MSNVQTYLVQILAELQTALSHVSGEQGQDLVEAIMGAQRVYVAGAGRSGLAVKGFAMRLMHLGFQVHVVGETTAPAITRDDLLLIGSASGATHSMLLIARQAREVGARVALITIRAESPLAQAADMVLTIPASTARAAVPASFQSIQPMGSLFEQSMWLTLDALVLMLMSAMHMDSATMFTRHANLE